MPTSRDRPEPGVGSGLWTCSSTAGRFTWELGAALPQPVQTSAVVTCISGLAVLGIELTIQMKVRVMFEHYIYIDINMISTIKTYFITTCCSLSDSLIHRDSLCLFQSPLLSPPQLPGWCRSTHLPWIWVFAWQTACARWAVLKSMLKSWCLREIPSIHVPKRRNLSPG